MKRKIYQQRNAEIQRKTYISAEVLFFLTCDQTFFVFFLCGGLDLITIQSNHLLGNPRYTLTERLLANLTDLWFRKKMALNLFNLSISFQPKHRSFQHLCCLTFLTRSRPCPSHAKTRYKSRREIIMGYPRYFSSELWWKGKFQENTKSSKTDTRRSLANEP